jgi:hypothetical protein
MYKRHFTTAVLTICILLSLTSTVLAAPDTPVTTYPGLHRWTGYTVDSSTSNLGAYTSIAFDPSSGIPFVSYYDATAQTVKLASPATNAGCGPNGTWWCRAIDDPVAKVGKYSSLDISKHGLGLWDLGIAYLNENNNGLRFAEYSCTLITCKWTYENVFVLSGATVKYASLKYGTDGVPHIAFFGTTLAGGGLFYATRGTGSSNCGGSTTWQCVAIEHFSGSNVGMYNSLALNGSNKARISYYDAVNHKLKYAVQSTSGASGNNCGADNAWFCRYIDPSVHDQGLFTSLALSSSGPENPHIAYYDKTSGMLKHAYFVGSGGNCGINAAFHLEWECEDTVNIGANMGTASNVGISIALDANKQPVIAYMNASEDQAPASLEIARPNSASGALIGNCGPTHSLFPEWTCKLLDGGGSYLNEADYASVGINSAGLAYVAYSEYDDYSSKYNLKVVFQQMNIYLPLVEK